MAFFKRNKGIQVDAAKDAKKEAPEAAEEQVIQAVSTKVTRADIVSVSPRVSEKAAFLAAHGKYAFDVPITATKPEVREARVWRGCRRCEHAPRHWQGSAPWPHDGSPKPLEEGGRHGQARTKD